MKSNRIRPEVKDRQVRDKALKIAQLYNGVVELDESMYTSVNTNFKWSCENGHTFIKNYTYIKDRKSFCKICKIQVPVEGTNRAGMRRVNLYSRCVDLANSHQGVFLSEKYITSHVHYQWGCLNNHTFTATYANVAKGHWCPYCINKTEERVRSIFEKIFNKEFKKSSPRWLKSPFSNNYLQLDGFNAELSIAFEYDGEYHYKPHFNNSDYNLERRKACDNQKTLLCKNHGVLLIRIPYTEKNNLEKYIQEKLNETITK